MKNDKNHDTPRNYAFIQIVSTVAVQQEYGGPWNLRTVGRKEIITTATDHTQLA